MTFKKNIKRNKNGRFVKGSTGYRKGLKKIRVSPNTEFKKGHTPWNKNKSGYSTSKKGSKEPAEYTQKRVKSLKENYKIFGTRGSPMEGKKHLEKSKRKMKESRKNIVVPKQDSKIELKIQDFLTLLKIEFFTHKYMNIKHAYQCDILIPVQNGIPKKTIIECDGDFYHCNPNKFKPNDRIFKNGLTAEERWKRDDFRTKELIEQGFNVIRLWENEIHKMELKDFQEVIKNV